MIWGAVELVVAPIQVTEGVDSEENFDQEVDQLTLVNLLSGTTYYKTSSFLSGLALLQQLLSMCLYWQIQYPQKKLCSSTVGPRIVRIQSVQFHYSKISAIPRNSAIFGSHPSIESISMVSNSTIYFWDTNAHYSRT